MKKAIPTFWIPSRAYRSRSGLRAMRMPAMNAPRTRCTWIAWVMAALTSTTTTTTVVWAYGIRSLRDRVKARRTSHCPTVNAKTTYTAVPMRAVATVPTSTAWFTARPVTAASMIHPTVSSATAVDMITWPTCDRNKPMSSRIRAITGMAEIDIAVAMNRANTDRPTAGPMSVSGMTIPRPNPSTNGHARSPRTTRTPRPGRIGAPPRCEPPTPRGPPGRSRRSSPSGRGSLAARRRRETGR